jgi:hypothetical protein
MFDGYESWSGKFDISAAFSVTPNVGILFRHPSYLSIASSGQSDKNELFHQNFYSVIYSNIHV